LSRTLRSRRNSMVQELSPNNDLISKWQIGKVNFLS
jgi:hypothetical protein